MEFIYDYMDNVHHRHLLNDMTSEIFGFTFEPWYIAGCYEGEYIPFSYLENGKIIANASANIMKMCLNGKEKCYIQIGTVMTRAGYRNKGLARNLIERIIKTYKDHADGFYLYGNLDAVGFYDQIGFKRLDQFRWISDCIIKRKVLKSGFEKAGEAEQEHYRFVLKTAVINAEFDHINRRSLQLFYTLDMDDVYYNKELDCFVVMNIQDEVLYLDSVVSTKYILLRDVLERVDGEYVKVVLGFTPKDNTELFRPEQFDGGDDYRFFYIGEQLECITKEHLFFPLMSHA